MTLQGEELLDALEKGEVRAAEPDGAGGWRVNAWVKEALLDIFRESEIVEQGLEATEGARMFRDKAALPVRRFTADDGVRVVPGGSAIRRGQGRYKRHTYFVHNDVSLPDHLAGSSWVGVYCCSGARSPSSAKNKQTMWPVCFSCACLP